MTLEIGARYRPIDGKQSGIVRSSNPEDNTVVWELNQYHTFLIPYERFCEYYTRVPPGDEEATVQEAFI